MNMGIEQAVNQAVQEQRDLTPEELDYLAVQCLEDPEFYLETMLWIRPKEGQELIPLTLNSGQRKLLAEVKRQLALNLPVRIIVLKARQVGFSTAIEGIGTWKSTQIEQYKGIVMAHERDGSKNLFQMFLRYVDNLVPQFRPMIQVRNESTGNLKFGNPDPVARQNKPGLQSEIIVETAEDPNAGRSGTAQFLHGSEVAFWPRAKQLLAALLQSIPSLPGTFIFLESTAEGASGEFYKMWKAAEKGENEYVPIFVAWWEHEDYRRPVTPDEEAAWREFQRARAAGEKSWDNRLLQLDDEELQLVTTYPIDFGQIKWRRYAIPNLCAGDIDIFHQEYPSCPDEAFLASGTPWFDTRKVIAMKERAKTVPFKRYTIHVERSEEILQPVLEEDAFGEVWVWKEPATGRHYCAGADPAEGNETSNASVAEVIDYHSGEQVAELYGLFDEDTFAKKIHWLCMWYNQALLGPEINNMGAAVLNVLENYTYYPNLYREYTENGQETQVGWRTTPRTRPIITVDLKGAVRERAIIVNSVRLCDEMLTFKRNNKGKPVAEEDCSDDCVMATCIAWKMREYYVIPWATTVQIKQGEA
jgi:hypothetical protein